jgi:hypothetical protein
LRPCGDTEGKRDAHSHNLHTARHTAGHAWLTASLVKHALHCVRTSEGPLNRMTLSAPAKSDSAMMSLKMLLERSIEHGTLVRQQVLIFRVRSPVADRMHNEICMEHASANWEPIAARKLPAQGLARRTSISATPLVQGSRDCVATSNHDAHMAGT